jgi:hypothetical protein
MRLSIVPMFTVFLYLGLSWNAGAQENADREIEIHRNVQLVENAVTPAIPADMAKQYRSFLPIFREALKDSTQDQTDGNRLVIQVAPAVKEVGAAKTKRPQARVTAFCRNSVREYVGSFLLHSYANDGPVNKEETEQFLRKQILEPLNCYAPTERVAAPSTPKREAATTVVETVAAPPPKAAETVAAPPPRVDRPTVPPVAAQRPQDKSDREIEIHRNVKLVEMAAAPDIPADLTSQYQSFLPVFREVLRESTKDQTEDSNLIIRIGAGVREVGASKTKRAQARITACFANCKEGYVSDFSLYSYASNGPVNKEETAQFLTKQILEPLEYFAPVAGAAVPPTAVRETAPPAAQVSIAAAKKPDPEPEPRPASAAPVVRDKSDREIEIHKNIRLVETAATPEIPAELVGHYQNFLPIFRAALKENTADQTEENILVIRISAGVREVGSAKTKRAQAHVAAFFRNSKREYVGDFLLHSYTTNGLVSKEETERFLRKQILEPLEIYTPAEKAAAPSRPNR